jgi:hypothetical protein
MSFKTYMRKPKEVKAVPMSRLDYNILRGWELPDDEDGSDKGFLMKSDDHMNWQPEDVFLSDHEVLR